MAVPSYQAAGLSFLSQEQFPNTCSGGSCQEGFLCLVCWRPPGSDVGFQSVTHSEAVQKGEKFPFLVRFGNSAPQAVSLTCGLLSDKFTNSGLPTSFLDV